MSYSVENPVQLGAAIVELRKAKGMTQEQLALWSDLSIAHLRDIEHGCANPTFKTFCRIVAVLEIPVGVFGVLLLEDEIILNQVHKVREILLLPRRTLIGV